jgi:hypothetical protein
MGPEGGFIKRFAERLASYDDLAKEENLRRLVADVSRCQMLEIIRSWWHPADKRFDVSAEVIWERLQGATYADVVEAVLRAVADFQEKPRLGNKNPDYWSHLPLLESLFSVRAKYLYIIRDGRDVYLSLQNIPWGGNSPYQAASFWRAIDENARRFAASVGKDRFLSIRYEDLLVETNETLTAMEDFLSISITADARAALLANSEANPKRRNFGKWKTQMSNRHQQVYEAVAGNTLRHQGYETRFENPSVSAGHVFLYKAQELARLVRINLYHARSRLPPD